MAEHGRPRRLGKLISKPIHLPPGLYHMISPSLVTPRDFDLSPYFEVIEFNLIAGARFDYRRIGGPMSTSRSPPSWKRRADGACATRAGSAITSQRR